VGAAAAVLEYAKTTQCQDLDHIDRLTALGEHAVITLDANSRRNLEIDRRIDGSEQQTLYALLDTCRTPMGARALRRWLNAPLRDADRVRARQQAVAWLLDDVDLAMLRSALREVGDLERIVGRLALGRASPRDLARLRTALGQFPALTRTLGELRRPAWPRRARGSPSSPGTARRSPPKSTC
jgi:DNA mismatch repair protein MutS